MGDLLSGNPLPLATLYHFGKLAFLCGVGLMMFASLRRGRGY